MAVATAEPDATLRARLDAAHAEAAAAGEPVDVPGVDPDVPASGQLSFNVGGKAPTSNVLRFAGGKINTPDEWSKGSLVRVTMEMRVGEVHFVDRTDPKTGQVVACERKQVLKPISEPKVEPLAA